MKLDFDKGLIRSKDITIIAIDPGTGLRSKLGIAIVDFETQRILSAGSIGTTMRETPKRIKDIANSYVEYLKTNSELLKGSIVLTLEDFVMRGQGGETLKKMVGALIGVSPYSFHYHEITTGTAKKIVTGYGASEKTEVAIGLKRCFPNDEHFIQSFIEAQDYDALDAIAIGYSAIYRLQVAKDEDNRKKR